MAGTTNSWNNSVAQATGSITLNASTSVAINAAGGDINIGNNADAQNMNIGTGASPRTITIGNTDTTTAVQIQAGSGGINFPTFTEGALITDSAGVISTVTGTPGFVLTANASGTAPSFQAAGGGGGVTGPGSSTDRAIATWNGSGGSALFDNSTAKISSGGIYSNSALPCAYVYATSNTSGATGDGTSAGFGNDFLVTTVFNVSSFWTGTGFQAPVTGKYFFCGGITLTACTIGSSAQILFVTTTGFPNNAMGNFTRAASSADMSVTGSCVLHLNAGDTTQVFIAGNGEVTTTETLRGGAFTAGSGITFPYSWCAGYLIA